MSNKSCCHDRTGTPLISRPQMVEHSGLSLVQLYSLYRQRRSNGHPEPIHKEGSTPYWDEAAWKAWYEGYKKWKLTALTTAHYEGDADELLSTAEAARVLGFSSHKVIHAYLKDKPGYFPEPDEESYSRGGRVMRYWRRETLWAFARRRQGGYGGGPTLSTEPKPPRRPYAKHPLIDAAREALNEEPVPTARELASRWNIPHYTASNLMTAARRMAREASTE